jgi:hypothetical protein
MDDPERRFNSISRQCIKPRFKAVQIQHVRRPPNQPRKQFVTTHMGGNGKKCKCFCRVPPSAVLLGISSLSKLVVYLIQKVRYYFDFRLRE